MCLQHFSGRRRNCYSIAIKAVHRALQFATIGRALRKSDMIVVSNCIQRKLYYLKLVNIVY
jgi:ribosomal protein L20